MKCTRCGREITKPLWWDEKPYGKECWKVIALPEMENQKQAKLDTWKLEAALVIETLKQKSLARIKNQWKLNFIRSVINQYETQGWLSRRQYDLAWDIFNQRDRQNWAEMAHEVGRINEQAYRIIMRREGKE